MKKHIDKKQFQTGMGRKLNSAFSHIYFRIFLVLISIIIASLVIGVAGIFSDRLHDVLRGSAPEESSSFLFVDVPLSHSNAQAIYALRKKGIVSGFADSKFRPEDKITRAELVALIVKSKSANPHGLTNSYCFNDVQKQWYSNYVCHAKTKGWVSGNADGTFKPDENVNRAATYKLLMGAFNVGPASEDAFEVMKIYNDVDKEDWFAPYVYAAFKKGWVEKNPQNNFHPYEELNRAQVAELLFKVISSEMPLL